MQDVVHPLVMPYSRTWTLSNETDLEGNLRSSVNMVLLEESREEKDDENDDCRELELRHDLRGRRRHLKWGDEPAADAVNLA